MSTRPIASERKPPANEKKIPSFRKSDAIKATYGAPNVNRPAKRINTSFKYLEPVTLFPATLFFSVKPPMLLSLCKAHAFSYNPSFTSFPKAFIKNLNTEKPAPRSALKPAVVPSRHMPSRPRSFARASVKPVAPTILPLL